MILKKNIERKAFPTKPKHQYHLSQWGECVFVASLGKECRLLKESLFVSFEGWTLILMNMMEEKLFPWNQSIHEKNVFIVSNHEINGYSYKNPCLSHLTSELWF